MISEFPTYASFGNGVSHNECLIPMRALAVNDIWADLSGLLVNIGVLAQIMVVVGDSYYIQREFTHFSWFTYAEGEWLNSVASHRKCLQF